MKIILKKKTYLPPRTASAFLVFGATTGDLQSGDQQHKHPQPLHIKLHLRHWTKRTAPKSTTVTDPSRARRGPFCGTCHANVRLKISWFGHSRAFHSRDICALGSLGVVNGVRSCATRVPVRIDGRSIIERTLVRRPVTARGLVVGGLGGGAWGWARPLNPHPAARSGLGNRCFEVRFDVVLNLFVLKVRLMFGLTGIFVDGFWICWLFAGNLIVFQKKKRMEILYCRS